MGVQLAEFRFGRTGWNPRIVRQAPAITEVKRREEGVFRIRVSGLLGEVVGAFAEWSQEDAIHVPANPVSEASSARKASPPARIAKP
jgi:hypothetical protein